MCVWGMWCIQRDCGLLFTAAPDNPRPRLPRVMLHVSGAGLCIVSDLPLLCRVRAENPTRVECLCLRRIWWGRQFLNLQSAWFSACSLLVFLFKGGPVGDPETGAGQVCQQVCRDVERREQTQAVHGHRPDWGPSRAFSGKMQLHVTSCHCAAAIWYDMLSVCYD